MALSFLMACLSVWNCHPRRASRGHFQGLREPSAQGIHCTFCVASVHCQVRGDPPGLWLTSALVWGGGGEVTSSDRCNMSRAGL